MKHLRIFEDFNTLLQTSDRERIESGWGFTIDDLEDILIELSDPYISIGARCKITTPSYPRIVRYVENSKIKLKSIPELIIISSIKNKTLDEYKSIVNPIIRELNGLGIDE